MAEFDNCKLLLVDKKITTARDIVGILEAAVRGSFPLMIMAEDIEQEALATMVVNKLRGTLKVGHLHSVAGVRACRLDASMVLQHGGRILPMSALLSE